MYQNLSEVSFAILVTLIKVALHMITKKGGGKSEKSVVDCEGIYKTVIKTAE